MKHIIKAFICVIITSYSCIASVSNYSFLASMATYGPITPQHTYGNAGTDDNIFIENIGFTFTYDGLDYTTVNIHSNGFLFFSNPWNVANYYPISSGIDQNVIAGCGEDLFSQIGGELSSATIGSPGSRIFIVQWKHYRHWSNGGVESGERNFQIKLYETSGKIEFVYGLFETVNFYSAQIGLLGSNLTDFKNRRTSSNWTATSSGASIYENCALTPVVGPPSGLTFTFMPPFPVKMITMVNPVSPGCSNSNSEIVAVRLLNTASGTFNFASNPIEVHSFVSGVNPTTFPNVILNSGTMPPNGILDVVLSPGAYNMSIPGNYSFYTNLYSSTSPSIAADTLIVNFNSVLAAGTMELSNDSICIGSSDTLTLVGANGTIQWQSNSGSGWVNETNPGYNSSMYIVSPLVNTRYRVLVCGSLLSNEKEVFIFSVPAPTVTGDVRCGPGQVHLTASGVGLLKWYPVDPLSNATPFALDNFSFESPFISTAPNALGQLNQVPFQWSGFGSVSVYSPNLPDASAYNTLGVIPTEGSQMAGTQDGLFTAPEGAGIYINPFIYLQPGKKYIFKVDVGGSYQDAGGTNKVRISRNNMPSFNFAGSFLAENVVAFPSSGNNWVENKVEYIATQEDWGSTVRLMVGTDDTDGPQTFDNARLIVVDTVATGNSYNPVIAEEGVTYTYEVISYVTLNNLVCHSSPAFLTATTTVSPAVNIFPDTIFNSCSGVSTTLTASSSNAGYAYSWSPASGLNTTTGNTVVATPYSDFTYVVTATDAGSGCVKTKNVHAQIDQTPSAHQVVQHPSLPCSGGPTILELESINPNPVLIGNGTITNAPSVYPAPFGNKYTSAKNTMLYRASELLAAGFTPGAIDYVSWEITNVNACQQLPNFSIKMGLTTDTSLVTFPTTLSQVTLPTWTTPVLGENLITLDSPFSWDGTSNLIVQTCFYGAMGSFPSNGNASMKQSPTTYTSSLVTYDNSINVCGSNVVTATFNQRPDIKLGRMTSFSYAWTPGTDLNDSTIFNPSANPATTTQYTYTISSFGSNCTISDTVTVQPNPLLPLPQVNVVAVNGSFMMCPGDSIQLDLSPACGNCDFAWTPALGVSDTSIANPYVSPTINTNYTLYVTDSLGCVGFNSHVVGLYAAPPTPLITLSLDTLHCTPATTYQWYLNGAAVPGATNQHLAISANGLYQVEITNGSNVCSSLSDTFVVQNVLVQKLKSENQASLSPNPFTQRTILAIDLKESQHVHIVARDILGKTIAVINDQWLSAGKHNIELDSDWFGADNSMLFIYLKGETFEQVLKGIQIQ